MAYSDGEKAEALIRLAINQYDYAQTAKETGVSVKQLRRWDKNVPKKGVADLLERAISRLLLAIPKQMAGKDWGVALGILLDKWLLLQGQPTQRSESITRQIAQMTNDEYESVIAEAERILAEARGRGVPAPPASQPG